METMGVGMAAQLQKFVQKLLESELNVYNCYQRVVKLNAECAEIGVVHHVKQRRRDIIRKLLDDFAIKGFTLPGDLRELGLDSMEYTGYLQRIEAAHIAYLEQQRREYYCPPECKKLIEETLLPNARLSYDYFSIGGYDGQSRQPQKRRYTRPKVAT